MLSGIDASVGKMDKAFFDQDAGNLSSYETGVLVVNVALSGWRFLVLLFSW